MFLSVAESSSEGGVDQHALGRSVGTNPATTSRNVAVRSDIGNRGGKGLNVIRVQHDSADRRRRVLRLSAKGAQVLRRILVAFRARLTRRP